ncbi:H-NS family nucleoid-associated regulatory protein [Paraburkholderia dilworthii]|uniref:H-NS family nucleoid-associated regulatory protein n=1 Tax=Paraburkholderia dilworthii TaxID=948106 RepID=UPI0004235B0E|nr:H-NS family nucleoid-associated regulatory protein [Paraburkholderia dilworthii]
MPTLEQIQAKLKKLQAQADILIARKAQVAIDQIRELMLKHGLTTADIEAKAKARRAANGLNGYAGSGKAKLAAPGQKIAKYRDHKTGATWTGHGRAPGWIAGAKDRSVFLIDGASEAVGSPRLVATGATHAQGKGQPKGAQPPKYRHPTTGATWSGRGPAPAWLASVKDRTRFLIDSGATAAASGAGQKTAGKAGKLKSAATSGAVSKKAAAKKVVAKKAKTGAQSVVAKKAAAKPAAKKVTARKAAAKTAGTKAVTKAVGKAPGRKRAAKADAAVVSTPAPLASAVQAGV